MKSGGESMSKGTCYKRLKRIVKRVFSEEAMFLTLVSVLSVLLVFSPYIQKDLVVGSDDTFHLIRIETLALALGRGEFPVKLHADLCYGFGYGVGFFYPNCFLYIPAVLINLGLSLEVAYKLFAGVLQIGIYMGMFLAVFRLTKNKYAALISAVLYLFSVETLRSFYMNFTMGRSAAMVFLPFAVVGIYRIVHDDRDELLFSLGFTGLVYSHVLTTVLAVVICALIALVYIKQWIGSLSKWKKILRSIVVVLILTAAFWVPMLEQWTAQVYRASQPWTFVDQNVMLIYDLLNFSGIGLPLLAISLFLGFWMIGHPQPNTVKVFYFLGVGFMMLTTVSPFWHLTRGLFRFLQFPSRLLVISTVMLILAVAVWFSRFSFTADRWQIIVSMLLIVNLYFATEYLNDKVHDQEDFGYRVLHEEIAGLGAGEEYLPIQTTRDDLVNPDIAYDDEGNPVKGVHRDGRFFLTAAEKSAWYDIPLVWYKGYAAQAADLELEIEKNEGNGLLRVILPENDLAAGTEIVVWYKGTILQEIAYCVTWGGQLC